MKTNNNIFLYFDKCTKMRAYTDRCGYDYKFNFMIFE